MYMKPTRAPGQCPAHVHAWTHEEDELLISMHGKKSYQEIADLLPRAATKATVAVRFAYLRRAYPGRLPLLCCRYTREEEKFIRENAHTMTSEMIGAHLNRPAAHIRVKAGRMGVSLFKCGDLLPHTQHSDHDVELIRTLRDEGMPFRELAEKFELSVYTLDGLYRRRRTAADVVAREYLLR